MLRETRGALIGVGATAGDNSFDAISAISLPNASRALPPNPKTKTSDALDLLARAKGLLMALAFGKALPSAPPTEDGITAPLAWHPSRPVLATVDNEGRILVHEDPARQSNDFGNEKNETRHPPPTAALHHVLHQRQRAMAWRPLGGATLAVAGGDGVCVWSRDVGASGDAVAAVAVDGDEARSSTPQSRGVAATQTQWRVRRLLDDCDDFVIGAASCPFRQASIGTAGKSLGEKVVTLAAKTANVFGVGVNVKWESNAVRNSSFSSTDSPNAKPPPSYDTVAWSPSGSLLAAASNDRSGISVWDVGAGDKTKIRIANNANGVSLLRWSGCGSYLFAAHVQSGFTVWATESWRARFWQTAGSVTSGVWGPAPTRHAVNSGNVESRGAVLLVACAGAGGRLCATHFSGGSGNLDAQVLPVDLPRAVVRVRGDDSEHPVGGKQSSHATASSNGRDAKARVPGSNPEAPDVAHMSWDKSGRRLAVTFAAVDTDPSTEGSEKNNPVSEAGRVGLFATQVSPVVRASLIGYVGSGAPAENRDTSTHSSPGSDPGGAARSAELSGPEGAAGCADETGNDQTSASTTLAICWQGGGVSVVPVFA